MKQIWAPWRMQYIRGEKEKDCVFCFDSNHDSQRHVLKRIPDAFVILNKYPYTNGHIMVIPTMHVSKPQDLPHAEYAALTKLLQQSIDALEQGLSPHGMNVGMNLGRVAGAGVEEHMHFHVVPRWSGDHNYMAVLAEVRMINQHLDETYQELLPFFNF